MMFVDLDSIFGSTAQCKSVDDVVVYIQSNTSNDQKRLNAAILGMLLTALHDYRSRTFRDDALDVLDKLSLTKQKIDRASCHQPKIVKVTADILLSAQLFVDEMTVPCTEWPTTQEIAEYLLQRIKEHSTYI
jgi:hypothetical protein